MGETIDFIRQADIKLWILTGNKIETAINIEFSYKLLDKKCKKLYILKIQLFYQVQNNSQKLYKKEKNVDI